jgi:hypothetical protein
MDYERIKMLPAFNLGVIEILLGEPPSKRYVSLLAAHTAWITLIIVILAYLP